MERINLTTDECPLKAEKEIRKLIADFFKGKQHEVEEMTFFSNKVSRRIQYQDVLPEPYVREHLERVIPNLDLVLVRDYSASVIDDVLAEMRTENMDVWCYSLDRQLCQVNLRILLEAWLSDKEIHKGQAIYGRHIPAR